MVLGRSGDVRSGALVRLGLGGGLGGVRHACATPYGGGKDLCQLSTQYRDSIGDQAECCKADSSSGQKEVHDLLVWLVIVHRSSRYRWIPPSMGACLPPLVVFPLGILEASAIGEVVERKWGASKLARRQKLASSGSWIEKLLFLILRRSARDLPRTRIR